MASLVALLPLLLCFCSSQTSAQPIGGSRDCPILAMLPLSRDAGQGHRDPPRFGRGDPPEEDMIEGAKIGFTKVAAIHMAMEDFNKRDSSIVPELASLPSSCDDVTLSWAGLRDTEDEAVSTVRNLINWLETKPDAVDRPDVCAIIGPETFRSVMDAAPLAAALDVPMMVYGTQQEILKDRGRAFTSIQANSWSTDLAHAVLSFLQKPGLERQYLAILQMQDPEEAATAADIIRYSPDYQIETRSVVADFKPVGNLDKELVRASLQRIQKTGYRTVLFAGMLAGVMPRVADIADELGMLDGSYLFVFLDEFTSREYFQHATTAPDAPLDKMLRGSVVISLLDGFEQLDDNPFMERWKLQRDVDIIAEMYARASKANVDFRPQKDFFQTELPGRRTTFLYDSVVAVGMGLCAMKNELGGAAKVTPAPTDSKKATLKPENDILPGLFTKPGSEKANGGNRDLKEAPVAQQETENEPDTNVERPPIGDAPPDVDFEPNILYKSILESANFYGASGYFMRFLKGSFVRDPKGLAYGAFNVRPRDGMESDQRSYDVVLVSQLRDTAWIDASGQELLYADGTHLPPLPTRQISNQNYLSSWVQGLGLSLMSVSLLLSLSCSIIVHVNRRHRLLRASQPVFLHLICAGSLLSAISILTMSFDEGSGWTNSQLSRACMAIPWLFFIGFVIVYAAMFSKLWRVNRVLQFRRQKRIQAHQVLGPFAVLLIAVIAVLTVWTIVDPLKWHRELIEELPPETYGQCGSDKFVAFSVPLCVIALVTMGMAAVMAFRTKHLPGDFSEWSWIFYAIFVQLQTFIVGMPVVILIRGHSSDAFYLGRVLLVWTFSVTSVLLILGPRLRYVLFPPSAFPSELSTPRLVNRPGGGNVYVTGLGAPPVRSFTASQDSRDPFYESFHSGQSRSRSSRSRSRSPMPSGSGHYSSETNVDHGRIVMTVKCSNGSNHSSVPTCSESSFSHDTYTSDSSTIRRAGVANAKTTPLALYHNGRNVALSSSLDMAKKSMAATLPSFDNPSAQRSTALDKALFVIGRQGQVTNKLRIELDAPDGLGIDDEFSC